MTTTITGRAFKRLGYEYILNAINDQITFGYSEDRKRIYWLAPEHDEEHGILVHDYASFTQILFGSKVIVCIDDDLVTTNRAVIEKGQTALIIGADPECSLTVRWRPKGSKETF